jgi:GMP synthase (glutamine-hydrolysing)
MNICVINNYTNKKLLPDFEKVFLKIDKNIRTIVIDSTDKHLIEKVQSFDAIILSGSDRRISKEYSILPIELLKLKIPILGICYGFQWMAFLGGGFIDTFNDNKNHKYNKFISIEKPFSVSRRLYTFSHHDYITVIPKRFNECIRIDNMIIMAVDKIHKIIGIQFHPEIHTSSANEFFTNWINWIR